MKLINTLGNYTELDELFLHISKYIINKKDVLLKFKIVIVCIFIILVIFIGWTKMNGSKTPKAVINQLVDSMNQNDWETFIDLQANINKADYIKFISNPDIKNKEIGLFNIASAKVIEIEPLPDSVSSTVTYKEKYNDVRSYLVGIDFVVKNESKYYFNGVNYRLIVLVKEKGKWKVIEMSSAPTQIIIPNNQST